MTLTQRAASDIVGLESKMTGTGKARLDDLARRVQELSDEIARRLFSLTSLGDPIAEARR